MTLSDHYPGSDVSGAQKDQAITNMVRDIHIDNRRKQELIKQLEKCK